ncbi:collagen triple helix repeat protein [Microbacterium sp. AG1240]|uniref:collagen-like triple helix repeat-containing protein n=1 Tax=Microbacterium sp. AG1240 TaxID=2183992 RepID=UPI000F170956|nr:collagen-like protein [Microbacterium sp. AG1240]RKT33664.1 collagen triple helix repeat protein [Microbacterium sp. AG1240]
MNDRGYLPRTPVTIVSENGNDAAAEAAMQAAAKAQQAADNARQMVLNRDTRLKNLEDVADTFATLQAGADDEHARLQHEIDTIALTPGPQGVRGEEGPKGDQGIKGDKGDTGSKGDTGAAGTAANIAVGTGRITAAVILGGTLDVVVTLSRTMPGTNYTVGIAPTTGMTFTIKARTTTTVTITVGAALALAVGATFQLIAWS